jgi:hypothetical protein
MNTKIFNLALMAFWLLLCLGLLTRELWMPAGLQERVNGPQTPLVVAVAGVLAVWNFIRFWIAQRFPRRTASSPAVEPPRRKMRALGREDPKVTDPQFRFDDQMGDEPR